MSIHKLMHVSVSTILNNLPNSVIKGISAFSEGIEGILLRNELSLEDTIDCIANDANLNDPTIKQILSDYRRLTLLYEKEGIKWFFSKQRQWF